MANEIRRFGAHSLAKGAPISLERCFEAAVETARSRPNQKRKPPKDGWTCRFGPRGEAWYPPSQLQTVVAKMQTPELAQPSPRALKAFVFAVRQALVECVRVRACVCARVCEQVGTHVLVCVCLFLSVSVSAVMCVCLCLF